MLMNIIRGVLAGLAIAAIVCFLGLLILLMLVFFGDSDSD